jgi:hypothetical protein
VPCVLYSVQCTHCTQHTTFSGGRGDTTDGRGDTLQSNWVQGELVHHIVLWDETKIFSPFCEKSGKKMPLKKNPHGQKSFFFFDYLLELMGAPTTFNIFIYNDDILHPASIETTEIRSK